LPHLHSKNSFLHDFEGYKSSSAVLQESSGPLLALNVNFIQKQLVFVSSANNFSVEMDYTTRVTQVFVSASKFRNASTKVSHFVEGSGETAGVKFVFALAKYFKQRYN
jgi:hypothetical protein